ncbi:hypothetical protein HanIR_Chr08g0380151 [Helianthus annuus]|nr:hypothetical protein HanIR_Chr08g0380151 [Helianthus annuus]
MLRQNSHITKKISKFKNYKISSSSPCILSLSLSLYITKSTNLHQPSDSL